MRSSAAMPPFRPDYEPFDFSQEPDASGAAVVLAHQIAAAVMAAAGPLFWTMLATGYLSAAFGLGVH
jgi:hypothetical protein